MSFFNPFYFGLPLLVVATIIRQKSKISTLLNLSIVSAYTLIVYQINNWIGHYTYYLRYVFIVLLAILWVKTFLNFSKLNLKFKPLIDIPKGLVLSLFIGYIFEISEPSIYTQTRIDLLFPLKNGTYVITEGGKTHYSNYHMSRDVKERQAIDISKINYLGSPLKNITLKGTSNNQFLIFGDSIFSPCNGVITKIDNNNNDHEPGEFNNTLSESPNLIKISHMEFNITIAHLKKGTISVQVGDLVKEGDYLGLVGNSGQSTAPHLHIHAEKGGTSATMFFNGKSLEKNDLVFL